MRRPPIPPRSLAGRDSTWGLRRIRVAPGPFARLALICYLMPVILVVFAIGGLAIGAGRVRQIFHRLVDSLPPRAPSPRDLAVVPLLSRKTSFSRGAGAYQKPRGLR